MQEKVMMITIKVNSSNLSLVVNNFLRLMKGNKVLWRERQC